MTFALKLRLTSTFLLKMGFRNWTPVYNIEHLWETCLWLIVAQEWIPWWIWSHRQYKLWSLGFLDPAVDLPVTGDSPLLHICQTSLFHSQGKMLIIRIYLHTVFEPNLESYFPVFLTELAGSYFTWWLWREIFFFFFFCLAHAFFNLLSRLE